MPDARRRFESAARRVRELSAQPSSREVLELYALYKQATVGDVVGEPPHPSDVRAHAKHEARSAVRGVSERDAMQRYVALVARLVGDAEDMAPACAPTRDRARGGAHP